MSLVQGLLSTLFPPRPETTDELRVGARAVVRGVVVPRDILESGLTGDRCVYYGYTVEEWRQSGMTGIGDGFWEPVARDEAIVEFYLQDDAGRIIVAPHDARVTRARGHVAQPIDVGVLNQRAFQLLIRPGDTVEVEGIVADVRDIHDEDRGYREALGTRALCAPERGELHIRVF